MSITLILDTVSKITEPPPAAASVEQNIDNQVTVLRVNTFTSVCFFTFVKYFVYITFKINDVVS